MPESKHTPGPWIAFERKTSAIGSNISDPISKDDFGFMIQMPSPPFVLGKTGAMVVTEGMEPGEGEANARLIAAATRAPPSRKRRTAMPESILRWTLRHDEEQPKHLVTLVNPEGEGQVLINLDDAEDVRWHVEVLQQFSESEAAGDLQRMADANSMVRSLAGEVRS